MFGIDKIEGVFENLIKMERKHTRDYYSLRESMEQESDPKRAESLLNCCAVESAHAESLQFAQGLLMDMMKKNNLWNGSHAQKINEANKKWHKEQYNKHNS